MNITTHNFTRASFCCLALFCFLASSHRATSVFAQQTSPAKQTPGQSRPQPTAQATKQTAAFAAAPVFPATAPETRRLVVEDSYFFQVRTFTPAVKVKYVTRAAASYRTPEDAAIARISALVAHDFAWFRSGWTEQAQAVLEAQDKRTGQTPTFWVNLWQKVFANRQIELTHRIETGEYVLIAYRIIGAGEGGKDVEMIDALKKENEQWLGTQEVSSDPVLSHWRTPDKPVKRIVRMASGVVAIEGEN